MMPKRRGASDVNEPNIALCGDETCQALHRSSGGGHFLMYFSCHAIGIRRPCTYDATSALGGELKRKGFVIHLLLKRVEDVNPD